MNAFTDAEQFDTSLLLEVEGNPIFGEDNEVIGWEEDLPYNDPAESDWEPDDSWFDEDALNSIGWGSDEAYF